MFNTLRDGWKRLLISGVNGRFAARRFSSMLALVCVLPEWGGFSLLRPAKVSPLRNSFRGSGERMELRLESVGFSSEFTRLEDGVLNDGDVVFWLCVT